QVCDCSRIFTYADVAMTSMAVESRFVWMNFQYFGKDVDRFTVLSQIGCSPAIPNYLLYVFRISLVRQFRRLVIFQEFLRRRRDCVCFSQWSSEGRISQIRTRIFRWFFGVAGKK